MSKPCIATLALITALGFSAAVDAQPATSTPSGQTHQDASASRHRILKPGDRNCLQSTGSLIPPRKGECLPVAGRSYSGRELRRTGAIDTAHALQMLDPSISLGH